MGKIKIFNTHCHAFASCFRNAHKRLFRVQQKLQREDPAKGARKFCRVTPQPFIPKVPGIDVLLFSLPCYYLDTVFSINILSNRLCLGVLTAGFFKINLQQLQLTEVHFMSRAIASSSGCDLIWSPLFLLYRLPVLQFAVYMQSYMAHFTLSPMCVPSSLRTHLWELEMDGDM